jgi:hypothetical protein
MAEVVGNSVDGYGVKGASTNGVGVVGETASQFTAVWGHGIGKGPGLLGSSYQGYGVLGKSTLGHGVVGETYNENGMAVWGTNQNVSGHSPAVMGDTYGRGPAVRGHSSYGYGVEGIGGRSVPGVVGRSVTGLGVHGLAHGAGQAGVVGEHTAPSAADPVGVRGRVASPGGTGVEGHGGIDGIGVSGRGIGELGIGVQGGGDIGVLASTRTGTALEARVTHVAGPPAVGAKAAAFYGPVEVFGNLTVSNGNKPFKIDHPLDPENRYLLHSAIESSERKNVYDGVAQLDEEGTAWVDLPEWFEALNGDFRYQLTAVGGAAPNLHVAEEVSENRFKIAGGEGGMRVCWQVTGTRKDPWAAANPFEVEQDKPQEERGRYLEPALYGAPEEQSVMRARLGEERLREEPPRVEPEIPERPPEEPPQPPAMPPDFDVVRQHEEHRQQIEELNRSRLEEEQQRQIDELREQIEEQKRGRVEEEIDDLRRQIKKLKRQR